MYLSKRPSTKFNNKTTEFMGQRYDSKGEAGYAGELQQEKYAGIIVSWDRQFKIDLRVNGKHITNYWMDFVVTMPDGSIDLREYKGLALPTWKLKWAILEATLEEVGERYWPGKEIKMTVLWHNSKYRPKGKKWAGK